MNYKQNYIMKSGHCCDRNVNLHRSVRRQRCLNCIFLADTGSEKKERNLLNVVPNGERSGPPIGSVSLLYLLPSVHAAMVPRLWLQVK